MSKLFTILKWVTRNNVTFLLHRGLLRLVYGNRLQQLANRDMFHRPEWFWGNRAIPHLKLERSDSSGGLPSKEKEALVADLITSFREAKKLDAADKSYSPLWATLIARSANEFIEALQKENAGALLNLLERMFPHPALWGIGYGDFGLTQGSRFASFVILHQLVGLAECLGIVRAECPEQGEIGYAFEHGLERLVERIEQELGMRLDFPGVGGAYGIRVGGRLIDMQTPGHVYAAYRLKTHLQRHCAGLEPRILEIGAGFGGAAYWFLQQHQPPIAPNYVILDLALTNVYQGWFLANALGREKVALFSDVLSGCPVGERPVSIVPVHSDAHFASQRFAAIFNQDSFPEMPRASVEAYLRLARERFDGILFSYNQEAFSPVVGNDSPWVSECAAQVGGLTRVSRELSWLRRGYVEEVYRPEDQTVSVRAK